MQRKQPAGFSRHRNKATRPRVSRGRDVRTGQGVPRDVALAAKWFRTAAEHGDRFGQYNIAVMLMKGQGVERNADEAATWFVKAAEQGVPEAQLALGDLYTSGQMPPPILTPPAGCMPLRRRKETRSRHNGSRDEPEVMPPDPRYHAVATAADRRGPALVQRMISLEY